MTEKAGAEPASLRLADLAARLEGRLEGDGALLLAGAAGLDEAGPAHVAFVDGPKLLARAEASRAGALLAPDGLPLQGRNVVRVPNPRLAYARTLEIFHPPRPPAPGIHRSAVVEEGARVDPTASVGALCFIARGARVGPGTVLHPLCVVGEEAVLGAGVLLHPHVTVRERVRLGDRVIVHAGAVIGSDGFGYVFDGAGHRKIPQVGTVEVGEDVEIGAGVTVDRATTGATRIGRGTKIDNLVQLGHNVEVGEHVILVSQVGVAGSSRIEAGAVLGGQVGVAGHLTIGAGARIAAQAGIMGNVPPGAVVGGMGPQPHAEWLRSQAVYEKLPELRRRVIALEKRLAALEAAAGGGAPAGD